MSAADWYKRQKNKLRRALSNQERSVSLPNPSQAQPPTSPAPQLVVNPTDEGNASRPLSSDNTSAEASKIISGSQPAGIPTLTESLPNLGVGALPSPTNDEMAAAISSPPLEDISKPEITWSGLNALLRVLKSGAGGFGPLESAIEGLERCTGIFEWGSKARADYQELGKKLDRLLGHLARFNNAWMRKAMTTSVKNLCGGIEAELGMIEEKQGRDGPGRHIEATEDSDAILECYRRIQGHVERLLLNANLNMWKIPDEEMTDRRLLQLCPAMSGAYNTGTSDGTGRRQCTKGTRVPELEKLKNWVRNPSTESIYWVNGMAGTGKTTIAYTLCAQLDATNELAASFFCTRLLPECRRVQRIIPAIAYQLAQFSYPFRYELSKALGPDQMAHTRDLETQFRTLITSPLKRIRHTLPSRFIVVIDALDECEDRNSIEKLLELLVASTSELPVRFLVSSRPEPEIYHCMMKQAGGNSNARLVLHELDPLEVQHDIEAYLRQELQDVPLTAHQWKELVERCGLLFVYASTACRYIKNSDEMMSCEEAVETVLGLSLEGTRDMEKELDKLYTVILETAFNKSQIGEANRKRMKMLLDSIICAQGPMTTDVLAVLLGLKNSEHARTLLRPLLPVVNLTEESGIATTLHTSFADFMLNPDRSAGFYCTATAHHLTLAHACLQQIKSNPVQFNICGIESSYLLDEEIADLRERVDRAVAPALLYACCHWIAHLELCGHAVDLLEPVMDFLSTRLLLWMEVLNVTMQSYYGTTGIIRLEEWCKKAHMSKEAIELAHDASEFVQSYSYKPVQQSTAHIYISMLPFWPSDSPIARCYLPRTSEMPLPEGVAIVRRRLPLLATRYMGEPMRAVCYDPNGHQITAAVGNDIYILGEETGRIVLGPLEGHTDLVTCVAISPNGLYIGSGSYDSTIRIWDAKSGKLVASPFKAHRDRVTSVAFSPDSTRIVTTGASEGLQIWSVPDGEPITSTSPLVEPSVGIRTATFSADGLEIISGDCNNAVCFWDAHTGDLISKQSREHTGPVNSVALSADGLRFVSASADSTICIWDTKGRQMVLGPLNGHLGEVNQAAFSPNDMYIASCAEDGTIRLWDAGSGQMITLTQRFSGSINSIAFSPDSSRLVSCTGDESVCIWAIKHPDVDNGILGQDIGIIRSASLSSDGSQIATGTQNGSLWLWDTLSGELVTGPLTGHEGYICSVAISSDGAYIASASSDKTIRLWGVKATKGAYKVLEHHTRRADTLRFTSDNLQLFYGSTSYSIGTSPFTSKGIEASNSSGRDEWAGDISSFVGCCITSSPDGSYAASGSVGGILRVWHAQTGQLIMSPLQTPPNGAFASLILFSPDGKYIVSCCAGNIVSFWPIPSRPNRKLLNYHSADRSKRASDSTSVTLRWKLTDSGWIVNHRNEHLIWVPDDLRPYLLRSGNERLISHRGSFKLDFTGVNIGELWTRSYRPVQ